MVQVGHTPDTQARIDSALDYLFRVWEELPQVAELWDTEWDDIRKLDYEMELAVPREQLSRVQRWFESGQMSPAQRARYEGLLTLIQRMQPTLDRMLAA